MKRGIIISAPSGSGKTSIIKGLQEINSEIHFSISATTRKPRGEEKDGIDYHFMNTQDFKKLIEENKLVEYQEVYKDQYYGTLKSELDYDIVAFDMDVYGGVRLREILGEKAISFLILPPNIKTLEERLRSRGTDSEESICERMKKSEIELSWAKGKFDFEIVNNNLQEAIDFIYECCRLSLCSQR